MKEEGGVWFVGVFVDVVDAVSVEGRGAADDAVDFVAFGKEEFAEVGTVLTGNASDEGAFGVKHFLMVWTAQFGANQFRFYNFAKIEMKLAGEEMVCRR